MGKAFHHNQPMRERTAFASIKRAVTSMDRSERLAIALLLIEVCFQEADTLTGLAEVKLDVRGGETFNEKAKATKALFRELPTRSLAELAAAILLPEISFIHENSTT